MGQGKIVFNQGIFANELWVVDDTGANLRRLLIMPSPIVTPRWSPNGSRIAFVSPGDTEIAVINEDGTGLIRIPGTVATFSGLTWDSAGTGLIYTTFCTCCEHLRAVNIDGSNNRLFFNPGSGVIIFPDARPNEDVPSSLVAYFKFRCGVKSSSHEFFGVEMTRQGGADFVQIPGSPGIDRQQFPRWSPDGSKLVTAVRIAATSEWVIEILDPFNPSAPRNRLLQGPDVFSSVEFGCNTDSVFFVRATDGFRNIWRVRTDGSNPTPVTNFTSGRIFDSGIDFLCTEIVVGIDIKPGSDPNAFNLRGHGVLPVAILTAGDFDAATVSPSTVRFGPAGASIAHRSGHLEDVDNDGDLDLVVHFRTQDTGIQCGATQASLTGQTFDGQPIQGSDNVLTVGCR